MGIFSQAFDSLSNEKNAPWLVFGFSLLLRFILGLHSYSGENTPPKYGDYEAQRHWMEITLNLPSSEWYTNSTNNNLQYWGLDYPPLTAYQSMIHGFFIRFFDPNSMALNSSHGFESKYSKFLMRTSVIASDVAIFFPSALFFVKVFYSNRKSTEKAIALAILLTHPPLLLIDHGHFQFNCISLGLSLAAVCFILLEKNVWGSIFFCLSLNHKQMSMYFAPAFFFHLLGKSFQQKNKLFQIFKLGIAVIVTFLVCWSPFLHSYQSFTQVLTRLFPFERGLFEDHVANFWCSTSPLFKWKTKFSSSFLARLAMLLTLLFSSPSLIHQLLYPSQKGFLFSLLNSSLSFYFFAYQVHEKSILLPLLPATMLFLEQPNLTIWFVSMASFSMFHLIQRDDLVLAYFSLNLLFLLFFTSFAYSKKRNKKHPEGRVSKDSDNRADQIMQFFISGSLLGAIVLHFANVVFTPPLNLPFLFPALFCLFSFCHFAIMFVYFNLCQWRLAHADSIWVHKHKEN